MQLFQQHILGLIENALLNAPLFGSPFPEMRDNTIVHISQREHRKRKVVPGHSPLTQKKGLKRRPCQDLPRAAATVVVDAPAGNADWVGRDIDLDVFPAVFFQKVDRDNNAHGLANLVGDILKQLAGIGKACDVTLIVTADTELAALRVGVAADPFQILVLPLAFPLYVLAFGHL